MADLVLASQSPRRRDFLQLLGLDLIIDAAEIDETVPPGLTAPQIVLELSREKARVVAARHPAKLVLAADTIVVLPGSSETNPEILGKPADELDAIQILKKLSGRMHEVYSGFVLTGPDFSHEEVVRTEVYFRSLSSEEIQRYVNSGECRDKAGAYGIQGGAAGFVTHIHGSYTNVVGLPLAEVVLALQNAGKL